MTATLTDKILFCVLIPSVVIYVIYMITLWKRRHHPPCDSPFFRMLFLIGLIDLVRLTEDWLMFKFPLFGWMGMERLVMTAPGLIAKAHTIVSWYFAQLQVLSTFWLAANRVSAICCYKDWNERQLKRAVAVLLLLPISWNIVLWPSEFYFSVNGTNGSAILIWEDTNLQWYFLLGCFLMCESVGLGCFICYAAVFFAIRKNRIQVEDELNQSAMARKHEIKMAFVGGVLAVLAFCCGTVCGLLAITSDHDGAGGPVPRLQHHQRPLRLHQPFHDVALQQRALAALQECDMLQGNSRRPPSPY